MGKPKYDPPTPSFPYRIRHRFAMLSIPRRVVEDTGEGMPALSTSGIRKSALRGMASDRVTDASWPYLWRLLLIKRQYKNKFPPERIERIDRMIESANATIYSKLANCVIDLKKQDQKDPKGKKKGWSESEWKKHMDYINQIAGPRHVSTPPPIERGERKNLEELIPRLNVLALLPDFKIYKRLSQETWYRNPVKVQPGALKYQISDRVKKLAIPKPVPAPGAYD